MYEPTSPILVQCAWLIVPSGAGERNWLGPI